MTVGRGFPVDVADIQFLEFLANFKVGAQLTAVGGGPANFGGTPNHATGPRGWASELSRVRQAIFQHPTYSSLGPGKYVSGPWPLRAFGETSCNEGVEVDFYYADTGNNEVLSGICTQHPGWAIIDYDALDASNSAPFPPFAVPTMTVKMTIEEQFPVRFSGVIFVQFSSTFDGLPTGSGSYTSNWPQPFEFGDGVHIAPGWCYSRCDNITVNPGEYTFTFTADAGSSMTIGNTRAQMLVVGLSIIDASGIPHSQSDDPVMFVDYTDTETVPGIHNSRAIKRIRGSLSNAARAGIFYIGRTGSPSFTYVTVAIMPTWSSTVPGVFFGKSLPVNSLGSDTHGLMPWNIIGTTVEGSPPRIVPLYRSPSHEDDVLPVAIPRWQASHSYHINDDAIDSNGNLQRVNRSGLSGGVEPTWSTVFGAQTEDNGARWGLVRRAADMFVPAVTKMFSATRFPVVRDGESDPDWIPHQKYPLFHLFDCAGWWIYRIHLHRFGTQDRVSVPQSGEIPVTLGCIRNGAFVAFGTYNTGTVVDLPDTVNYGGMWPIFTATELAYQATERVDVQASVINMPEGASQFTEFVNTQGPISQPISASHYVDTELILFQL